jgi:hypothetical protein
MNRFTDGRKVHDMRPRDAYMRIGWLCDWINIGFVLHIPGALCVDD